jgi:hypothetical protein
MTSSIAAGSWAVGALIASTLALMIARLTMSEFARLKGSRSIVEGDSSRSIAEADGSRAIVEGESSRSIVGGDGSRSTAEEREPFRRAGYDDGFGIYLAWVGLFTACAYPLSCNVALHAPPLLRYLLLALLLPVGLFVAFMQRERSRALRAAVAAVFVLWGAVNLWDNLRLIREAVHDPPGSEHRVLVDYLLQQRIRYARAIYWDAYMVDFLSGERIVTASVDVIRIPEYQKLVDEHAGAAVNLERLPCSGSRRVASWCVTEP